MEDPGPSSAYYSTFPTTSNGPLRPLSPPTSPLLGPTDPTPTETLNSLSQESYYALLNLPNTASTAEIKERYRSLAGIYHPDRQLEEGGRRAAHSRFTDIQRAYEVLVDDTRRTVYDLFGEEGLRTSWEVGPRVKTPEEMRAHFQKQAYAKRQMEVESLVKPKSDISLVLDARAVFLPRTFFRNPERVNHSPLARLARVRTGRVMMKHSFETPINDNTQITWTGQMVSRGGQGGGNLVGTVRHQFSPRLWVEGGVTLLNPRILTGKGTYTFDENTFLTVNAIQRSVLAPPTGSVTLGRRLYPQTTGFLTYKTGFYTLGPWGTSIPEALTANDKSGLSVGLTNSSSNGTGWTVETAVGHNDNHIEVDYSFRVLGGLKIKVGAGVGTAGINGFLDSEGKITENVRGGMILQVDLGGGIVMRLKFNRLGQKITIPILLSENFNPYVALFSTVIPAAAYTAVHHFYLLPRKQKRIAERIKELRTEHADYIMQKKEEAREAVLLMERPVAQKIAQEREKNGLIIVSAHYGLSTAFTEKGMRADDRELEEIMVDVTIPLQSLVSDSKLLIPGGRAKFNLLGFWDPCIGENKSLRVRYLFRNQLHQVTINDVAVLRAPLKAHRLEE